MEQEKWHNEGMEVTLWMGGGSAMKMLMWRSEKKRCGRKKTRWQNEQGGGRKNAMNKKRIWLKETKRKHNEKEVPQ